MCRDDGPDEAGRSGRAAGRPHRPQDRHRRGCFDDARLWLLASRGTWKPKSASRPPARRGGTAAGERSAAAVRPPLRSGPRGNATQIVHYDRIYENGRCVLHSGPPDHVLRQLERFGVDEGQAERQFVRGGASSPAWPRQSRPRLRVALLLCSAPRCVPGGSRARQPPTAPCKRTWAVRGGNRKSGAGAPDGCFPVLVNSLLINDRRVGSSSGPDLRAHSLRWTT
jgi:hypothetical protein